MISAIGMRCRFGSCRAGSACCQQVTRSGASGLSSFTHLISDGSFTGGENVIGSGVSP